MVIGTYYICNKLPYNHEHSNNLYLYRTIGSFCIIQLDIAKIIIYIPKIKNYSDKQILNTTPPIKLSSICVNTNQIRNSPFRPEECAICIVFVELHTPSHHMTDHSIVIVLPKSICICNFVLVMYVYKAGIQRVRR